MNYELLYKLEVEAFGILERDYHELKHLHNIGHVKRISLEGLVEAQNDKIDTLEEEIRVLDEENKNFANFLKGLGVSPEDITNIAYGCDCKPNLTQTINKYYY